MLDLLTQLDTWLFLQLNGCHAHYLDKLMMLITGKWVWIPMYACALLVLIRHFGLRRALVYVLALTATIVLTDQLCSSVIRPLTCRLRPSNPDNPLSALAIIVDGYRGGRYGFPSCHAANSFALAFFLSLAVRNRMFILFLMAWATLNSFSRLYLGVHYPGDLLCGAVIGMIAAVGMFHLAKVSARTIYRRQPAARPVIQLPVPTFDGFFIRFHILEISASTIFMTVGLVITIILALLALQ